MTSILTRFAILLLSLMLAVGCTSDGGSTEQQGTTQEPDPEPTPDPDPDPDPEPEPEPTPDPTTPDDGDETTADCSYEAIEDVFPNPERGFYYPYAFYFRGGDIPTAVNINALNVNRKVSRTLVLLEYFLHDFVDKPLSQDVLNLVEQNMLALRDGGVKCVLRFAYSDGEDEKPWDATEAVVLGHISQLKPLFQKYGDVIYVLQAGFIGVWGEWYYTDNFNFGAETVEDYAPRRRVMDALLDAMPKDRQVALRTPFHLMMCYNLTAADGITPEKAHDGSDRSRLAGHNDCFLASGNDVGTFNNKQERELWMNDTRYVIMGGETCGTSRFCACDNSLSDMEKYHWSYLNIAYHKDVLKGWRDDGCYDDVERRLGYRFVLTEGHYTSKPEAGKEFKAKFTLRNDGFASVINPRPAELVLTDAAGSTAATIALDADPRTWFGGETITVDHTFTLPESLAKGSSYTLWLRLPDAAETLANNPAFSIRMANADVWDENSGMNKLYTFNL